MLFGMLLCRGAGYGLELRRASTYGAPDNWLSRGEALLFGAEVLAVSYAAEHLGATRGAASGESVLQDQDRCAMGALA